MYWLIRNRFFCSDQHWIAICWSPIIACHVVVIPIFICVLVWVLFLFCFSSPSWMVNLWFWAFSFVIVPNNGHSAPFNRLTFGFGFYMLFFVMSVENLMIVWFLLLLFRWSFIFQTVCLFIISQFISVSIQDGKNLSKSLDCFKILQIEVKSNGWRKPSLESV